MLFYFYYFKRVLQIAAHCQKNLDLAVATKESGEIVNYWGKGGGGRRRVFLYLCRLKLFKCWIALSTR